MYIDFWKFDKNNDGILENPELKEISKDLWNLQLSVVNSISKNLPDSYVESLKGETEKEQTDIILLFAYARKVLWKDFYDEFLAKWWKYRDIPLKNMIDFINNVLLTKKTKQALLTKQIILTEKELWKLYTMLADKKTTVKDLQNFIDDQLNEDITSVEILEWTDFAKDKEGMKFMKGLDQMFFKSLCDSFPNLSKDVLRNMATWTTFTFLKLTNTILKKQDPKKIFNALQNNQWNILDNIGNIIKKENQAKVPNLLNSLNGVLEWIKGWEKNAVLMDPQKFSNLFYKVLTWTTNDSEIKQALESKEVYDRKKRDTKELKQTLKEVFQNRESFDKFIKSSSAKEVVKKHISSESNTTQNNEKPEKKEESFWDIIEKFFKWIMVLFTGTENWNNNWDEKIEDKFPDIFWYLKEHLTFKNIKKNKESIFYKALNQASNGENVKVFKTKWNLSLKSVRYLKQIWGDGKDNITKNLDKFFNSKDFDKKIWKKKEDFYKKLITIKDISNTDKKWNTVSIKTWILNLDEINKIIEGFYDEKEKKINVPNKALTVEDLDLSNTDAYKKALQNIRYLDSSNPFAKTLVSLKNNKKTYLSVDIINPEKPLLNIWWHKVQISLPNWASLININFNPSNVSITWKKWFFSKTWNVLYEKLITSVSNLLSSSQQSNIITTKTWSKVTLTKIS